MLDPAAHIDAAVFQKFRLRQFPALRGRRRRLLGVQFGRKVLLHLLGRTFRSLIGLVCLSMHNADDQTENRCRAKERKQFHGRHPIDSLELSDMAGPPNLVVGMSQTIIVGNSVSIGTGSPPS